MQFFLLFTTEPTTYTAAMQPSGLPLFTATFPFEGILSDIKNALSRINASLPNSY